MSFGSTSAVGATRWLSAVAVVIIFVASRPAAGQGTQPGPGAQADPPPWPAPARSASKPNPLPKSAAVVKQGETLYRRDCELCHGVRGAGDGQMAPTLPTRAAKLGSSKVQSQSDGALFWKIRQGRGVMPTTEVTLTDDERWAIVHFLRTFGRRR